MRLALREDMTPGKTLTEQLTLLERLGFDGIELCAGSLDLPVRELRAIFAAFPVRAANVTGSFTLLHSDPAEWDAGKDQIRRRESTLLTSTSPTAIGCNRGAATSTSGPVSRR